jgi:hypothetical protein
VQRRPIIVLSLHALVRYFERSGVRDDAGPI